VSDPRRILLRAPNWLGDVVMALPAMGMIRRGMPDASLSVAVPAAFAPIFEGRTPVGPASVVPVAVPSTRAEQASLRAGGFDAAVLFTNSLGSAWTAWRAGIPERWGYATSARRVLLTRVAPRAPKRIHQVEYYRALAAGLGMPEGDEAAGAAPGIAPSDRAREAAAALFDDAGIPPGPVVGFGPGAAYGYAKRWPPPSVAAVVRAMSARGVTCVLLGARGDAEAGSEIESALGPGALAPGRLVNLIGRTDVRQLVGVLARCDVFVTNDSGAMHLAAALGRPVVAMFGPTSERATAPRGGAARVLTADVFCRPCMLRECPIDHRCMKRIAPETVIEAIEARLG
jgi:heptosyltransferase-2